MWLNRRLALLWQAGAVAAGIAVATGQPPSPELFEALHDTELEAAEAEWQHHADLMEARIKARGGRPG